MPPERQVNIVKMEQLKRRREMSEKSRTTIVSLMESLNEVSEFTDALGDQPVTLNSVKGERKIAFDFTFFKNGDRYRFFWENDAQRSGNDYVSNLALRLYRYNGKEGSSAEKFPLAETIELNTRYREDGEGQPIGYMHGHASYTSDYEGFSPAISLYGEKALDRFTNSFKALFAETVNQTPAVTG